jgi:hypothetical protein
MKFFQTALFIGLISLSNLAFAQTPSTPPPPTEAQKSYDIMKSLAGVWLGTIKTDPADMGLGGNTMQVTIHVTSSGNAVVHEMKATGTTIGDISLFDKDEDRLLLTHFCDAANRPRFVGKLSPDGKTLEFNFLDVAGGTQYGYLQHVVFTLIDAEHHTEDWVYMQPGGKLITGHMDLRLLK